MRFSSVRLHPVVKLEAVTTVLLRVMNYPCCAGRDAQPLAQYRIVSKTEIDKCAGYLQSRPPE